MFTICVRYQCFNLICQQVQNLLVHARSVLTDMQIVLRIRLEAGHKTTFLKNTIFTAFAVMMGMFTDLKMMNVLVLTYGDREIFHNELTYWVLVLFPFMSYGMADIK